MLYANKQTVVVSRTTFNPGIHHIKIIFNRLVEESTSIGV